MGSSYARGRKTTGELALRAWAPRGRCGPIAPPRPSPREDVMTEARQSLTTLHEILDEAAALAAPSPELSQRIADLHRALDEGDGSASIEHEILSVREVASRAPTSPTLR